MMAEEDGGGGESDTDERSHATVSAGLLLTRIREGSSDPEIVVILRCADSWELAKGRLEATDQGDKIRRAFVEMSEEAGILLELPQVTPSRVAVQRYNTRYGAKSVHWYHYHLQPGQAVQLCKREDRTREVRWVTSQELRQLRFNGGNSLVMDALARAGAIATTEGTPQEARAVLASSSSSASGSSSSSSQASQEQPEAQGDSSSTVDGSHPAQRRAAGAHPQPSSAAQPPRAAPGLSEYSRAQMFLAALEEAAYQREDNAAQAELLRELANALSLGRLLLVPTDDVWHRLAEEREDFAMAKLGQLIELVASIRTAWIASPESEHVRAVAGRRLGPLAGDMYELESIFAVRLLSREKRAEYDFCFQASGSKQLLFAFLRHPSVLRGEGLEILLEQWASIKKSPEYTQAVEQQKQCTEEQTKQEAVLQNLRMQINRSQRKGEDTEDLFRELWDTEKGYERGQKRLLRPTRPPRSAHNRVGRAQSARRAWRSRLETADIPAKPDRPPPRVFNWAHEITPDADVDWKRCPEDWEKELRLRQARNEMIKEELLAGNPVLYRSSGWSLYPRVCSNDLCTYEPVTSADEVNIEDIVFCQVQPGDRFYAHLVSHKWFEDDECWFTISNLKGRSNGWCSIKHIYGRLIRVEH